MFEHLLNEVEEHEEKKNPLELAGINPQLLKNLAIKDGYELATKSLSSLASMLHPDSKGTSSTEEQLAILDAFNSIDSLASFSKHRKNYLSDTDSISRTIADQESRLIRQQSINCSISNSFASYIEENHPSYDGVSLFHGQPLKLTILMPKGEDKFVHDPSPNLSKKIAKTQHILTIKEIPKKELKSILQSLINDEEGVVYSEVSFVAREKIKENHKKLHNQYHGRCSQKTLIEYEKLFKKYIDSEFKRCFSEGKYDRLIISIYNEKINETLSIEDKKSNSKAFNDRQFYAAISREKEKNSDIFYVENGTFYCNSNRSGNISSGKIIGLISLRERTTEFEEIGRSYSYDSRNGALDIPAGVASPIIRDITPNVPSELFTNHQLNETSYYLLSVGNDKNGLTTYSIIGMVLLAEIAEDKKLQMKKQVNK